MRHKKITAKQTVDELFAMFLAPPPRLSVSSFAEKERYASVETSASSGRWKNMPYQIAMQDSYKEPKIKTAVFMTATQIGKTEIIKNIIAYSMVYDTGSTTFMLPSEAVAKDYSKAQLGPLIRDTKILRDKIPSSRKDGNNILNKSWVGGYLRLVGSQTADKLSSFPSPRIFIDELDRCTRLVRNSAGIVEGSPIDLFLERSKNWSNRFALFTSTPTVEGVSPIENWWLKSDQRLPLVPCIHCGFYQFLEWEQFTWKGKGDPNTTPDRESFCFECKSCHETFDDKSRNKWLPLLRWGEAKA